MLTAHSYTGQADSPVVLAAHSYTGQADSPVLLTAHSYTGQADSPVVLTSHSYTGQADSPVVLTAHSYTGQADSCEGPPPPLLYRHMTQWLRPPRSALPAVHFRCTNPITSVNIHLPHPGKSGLLGFSHCLIETLTRGHVIELTWGQAVKRPRRKLGKGGMKESRCSATSRCLYRPSDTSEDLGTNLGALSHFCRSVWPCRNASECERLVS